MNWKKISETVGKFAPVAGGLLGGPAGATVGSLVSSALGVENSPDAVLEAVKKDPEAALKLKQMELDHKTDLEQIALDTFKAEAADRSSAREAHRQSRMPGIICIALTFMVAGGAYMLFSMNIPEGNREIAYLLFGTLLAKWGDSIAYWVGTTRSSAQKTSLLTSK